MELENEEAFTTTTNNPTTVTSIDGNRDYYNNHQYTHVPSVQVMELKSKELVDALTNHRSTSIFYENKNSTSTTAISASASSSSKETTPTPAQSTSAGDKETLADKINYYYTVTTDSSNLQTDDAEHYTNHRLSLSREVDSHRSTTPITETITYNPIYYHESFDINNNGSNSQNNNSSTDHTILNHILSLIAVGESPPEVKVFTRTSKKDDGNLQGAFSTHVEVHQRYPRRRRSTMHDGTSQGKFDDRAAMKSLPLTNNSNRYSLSHPITFVSFIMSLISLITRFF